MTSKHEILFICTGNSGRSILAESIVNNEYSEKLVGFSAGTLPRDEVNPEILKYLNETGHDTSRLNPKSWEVYGSSKAHKFDIIVTVCDQAANEACPVWPGNPTSCHWGVPDPTKIEDKVIRLAAIHHTYKNFQKKIVLLSSLSIGDLDAITLKEKLSKIAKDTELSFIG